MKHRAWTYSVAGIAVAAAVAVGVFSARPDEQLQLSVAGTVQGDLAQSTSKPVLAGQPRAEYDSAADVRVADCGEIDDAAAVLLAQQRAELSDFHRSLKGTENRLLTLELAAESAGYDLEAVRFGRIWLVDPAVLEFARIRSPYPLAGLPHARGRVPLDEHEAVTLVDTLLQEDGLERMGQFRNVVVTSRDSLGTEHETSLLAMMIRQHAASMTAWLPDVPAEWPIGVHELAVAIDAGVSAHDFEALLDLSGVDPGTAWRRPDPIRQINLAHVAAYHIRPAIVRTLLARGANPASDRQSVLDDILLRVPTPDRDLHDVEEVVRQLVATGLKPRRPSALAVLEARYPDLAGIGLGADTTIALASGAVTDAAAQLTDIKSKWTAELHALHSRGEHCPPTLAPDPTSEWSGSITVTLREKVAYDQWLQHKDKAAFMESPNPPPGRDDPFDRVSQALRDGYDSAIEGRWEEAIDAAWDVDPADRSYFLADLLTLSLRRGAPIEVIGKLISLNDGLLPEDAVLGLSARYWGGAVSVAKELIPHGLDIHHVDSFGHNAFSSLARSYPVNLEMAAFLAAHSVSPKPSPRGKDPLDLILSRMVRMAGVGRTEFEFARLLVSIGAPIESSHRELAGRLALVDPQDYRKLVNAIPELEGDA